MTPSAAKEQTERMHLNEISLEQALIDFEVANARVIDLTRRLTTMSKDLLALRAQVELERTRAAQLQQELTSCKQMPVPEHPAPSGASERELALSNERARVLAGLVNSRILQIVSFFAPKLRSALIHARAAL